MRKVRKVREDGFRVRGIVRVRVWRREDLGEGGETKEAERESGKDGLDALDLPLLRLVALRNHQALISTVRLRWGRKRKGRKGRKTRDAHSSNSKSPCS